MSDNRKAEIVFREELQYIKHSGIKDIVLKCFAELAPDYFWTSSASSSHKHHPKVSNKLHGIIIHTKLAVWWARKLSAMLECDKIDIIIASLLLHDLQKFGRALDKDNLPTLVSYASTHGLLLAIQIEQLFKDKLNENIKKDFNIIVKCIALHMGRWTEENLAYKWRQEITEEEVRIADIVCLADYCASQKVDEKLEGLDNYKIEEI